MCIILGVSGENNHPTDTKIFNIPILVNNLEHNMMIYKNSLKFNGSSNKPFQSRFGSRSNDNNDRIFDHMFAPSHYVSDMTAQPYDQYSDINSSIWSSTVAVK
jgi:hypothetical protein